MDIIPFLNDSVVLFRRSGFRKLNSANNPSSLSLYFDLSVILDTSDQIIIMPIRNGIIVINPLIFELTLSNAASTDGLLHYLVGGRTESLTVAILSVS